MQLVGTPLVAMPVHVSPASVLRNRFVPVCETPTQITGVALPGVPLLRMNSINEIPTPLVVVLTGKLLTFAQFAA